MTTYQKSSISKLLGDLFFFGFCDVENVEGCQCVSAFCTSLSLALPSPPRVQLPRFFFNCPFTISRFSSLATTTSQSPQPGIEEVQLNVMREKEYLLQKKNDDYISLIVNKLQLKKVSEDNSAQSLFYHNLYTARRMSNILCAHSIYMFPLLIITCTTQYSSKLR